MAKRAKSRRRSRSRNRKNTRPGFGHFLLFITTRLVAGLAFVFIVVLVYFDYEIQQRLAGNLQSEPAHVYARPLELSPGSSIRPALVIQNLQRQGYKHTDQIAEPGEFASGNQTIDIFVRPVANIEGLKVSRAIRIKFTDHRVTSLVDHASGDVVEKVTLEPPLIGSLQLGSYKDRIALKLHQMPELLIRSLLAMEDRNFESHYGIDPKAVARAVWSNVREGKTIQGGSTITQQLVKNLFLGPERTLARKITEAMMALALELRFSKAEILELYLNEIFLGQSGNRAVHGFALASEYFFGRSVTTLKLHETAMLVGMIPAPSYYNPRRNPQRALDRRNLVLKTLVDVGAISSFTADSFSKRPLGIVEHRSESTSDFPAYIDYLHRQLRQYYSEEVLRTSGLRLYTSLDSAIQQSAQDKLSSTLATLEQEKGFPSGTLQGAAIVVDPAKGEILALVGDRKKGFSGFNRAIDAERPIGSLVKPAIYLTALEDHRRYSLVTILEDSPITLSPEGGEEWSPQNYDKKYRGPIPMYQALVKSYNVPTVRLGLELGVPRVIDTMHRLGIERNIQNYPSTLLGASHHTPLEVAQMYQALSNDGLLIPLRSIRNIVNHRGDVVARFPASEVRAVDQDSAYLINYALQMVVRSGTAAALSRSFPRELGLAGKTGTTDNFRDSWFAGYSGNLLTVVWVGRDDNKPINLSGSSGAMVVWEQIMSGLDLERKVLPSNDDIVFAQVDTASGLAANNKCLNRVSIAFVQGTQPERFAPCSGLATKLKSWFSINTGALRGTTTPVEQKKK